MFALFVPGSEIPSEPSYIMLNTAVSSQWGFPTCPGGCPCTKYDCNGKDWQSRCGFPEGFCDMMTKDPPQHRINWVRVYQNPNKEEQKVGCSTPERPTRRFIEAHAKNYKTERDEHPLRKVEQGLGNCSPGAVGVTRDSCGGLERGRCTHGKGCECIKGWTGPHCLSREGSDPILYDVPDKITDVGFIPPDVSSARGLIVGFVVLLVVLLVATVFKRNRTEVWTPIPDAETTKFTNSSGYIPDLETIKFTNSTGYGARC
jgi:hypothetical protein